MDSAELQTPVGQVIWDLFLIFKGGGWLAFVAVIAGATLVIHGWPIPKRKD